MKEAIASGLGHVAGAPAGLLELGCTGIGFAGTGIKKAGEFVESVGFAGAQKMGEYRQACHTTVEEFILGLGEEGKEAEEAPNKATPAKAKA